MRGTPYRYDIGIARGDMDGASPLELVCAATKTLGTSLGGIHEALAAWVIGIGRAAGFIAASLGTTGGAEHCLRVRTQSAAASNQYVFRRSLRRRRQLQRAHFRALARQHLRSGLCRRRHPVAGV